MRPGEVLDARTDLVERLHDERFRGVLNEFGGMEYGRSGGFREESSTPYPDLLSNALKEADTYRVTQDMSIMVQHAADQLDDLDRIDPSLAPSQCGFVSFDRPLPLVDQRGKTMLVNFLIWGPVALHMQQSGDTKSGTLISTFNDVWRTPDEVQEEWVSGLRAEDPGGDERTLNYFQEVMGRWAAVASQPMFDQQRLGPAMHMPPPAAQAKLLAEGVTPHEGTNMTRYVHALWLMMGQTVARVEEEKVDRPSRRRAEKRRLPSKVTVIKLRREQGDYERREGESLIEWSHRWVVKGHWRWQAVGEHHPLAQEIEPGKFRARIWINPFVKGPADKPFHQSEKIYSLER